MSNVNERAWRASARRQIVLGGLEAASDYERADACKDSARHVQQAAICAVRAGRKDVAESLLNAWEKLESTT